MLMVCSNVDRLWDIWQALNPNAYVIDKITSSQDSNFFIAANTRINPKTDLKPFYDASATGFWNPAGVQYTKPFGYAYPETQRWLYSNDSTYQTAVRSQVTNQYGANVINNFFSNIVTESESPNTATETGRPVASSLAEAVKNMRVNKSAVKEAVMHPVAAAQQILAQDTPTGDHAKAVADDSAKPAASEFTTITASEVKPVVQGAKPATTESGVKTDIEPIATADSATIKTASANAKPSASDAKPTGANTKASVPAPSSATPASSESHLSSTPEPLNVPPQFAHLVKDRTYTEWIVNLRTIKHALNQTFRVYIFLGDFNPDPATWPTEHNVVGRFTVLGRSGATPCAKCKQDRDSELVVTGTVPLTSALLQDIVAGHIGSLEPADVEAYLERHLHWRVTVFDGSEVQRDQVPGLKVSVVSTKVRIGEDELPVYSGVYEQHLRITDGRPAGVGVGEM